MVTKTHLLRLLTDDTGDMELAAERLGVSVKTIRNWPTDKDGRVYSRAILDAVMAALMREYLRKLKARKLALHEPSGVTLDDLYAIAEV